MEILEWNPKMLLELLERMGASVSGEKPEARKQYKNDNVFFCRMELSRAIVAGELSKWTGSFLRKAGMETSQLSAITTPPWICPIPSVLFLWAPFDEICLPGPQLALKDFLFVENSNDKLYNDKWWPGDCGSVPSVDLKLSCN